MPTAQEHRSWMDRARPLNPGVPDQTLTTYYSQQYGEPEAIPTRAPSPLDDWLPRAREANPGTPDETLTSYWQKKYGVSAQARADESDFMRGLEGTAVGLKSAAYGIGAGVGETGEYLFGSGGAVLEAQGRLTRTLPGRRQGIGKTAPAQRQHRRGLGAGLRGPPGVAG